ncbi:MAG: hypothetical protein KGJ08_04870 [Gammaproteobacteria bacterium]|nr:hypothetical protein [Gammaproteobacteria bacterium]
MVQSETLAKRPGKLGREIVLVLLFKAVALSLIWALFFSAPPPHTGSHATAVHLLGSGTSIQILQGAPHD